MGGDENFSSAESDYDGRVIKIVRHSAELNDVAYFELVEIDLFSERPDSLVSHEKLIEILYSRPCGSSVVQRTVIPPEHGRSVHLRCACKDTLRREVCTIAAQSVKIVVFRIARICPFSRVSDRRFAVIGQNLKRHNPSYEIGRKKCARGLKISPIYDKVKKEDGMQDLTLPVDGGILNIRVGAIIMKDGKILMVGNDRTDYDYSVGGRVRFGESAEDAVVREVYEETGVRMKIDRLGFIHENFFPSDVPGKEGKIVYEISFYFYMNVPEGFEPVCESFEEGGARERLEWLDLDAKKTFYPEFFRTKLAKPSDGVKHILTRDL